MAKIILKAAALPGILCLLLLSGQSARAADIEYSKEMPQGMQRISSNEFDALYIKPGFNPGAYNKVIIDEPKVTLQKYWSWKFREDIKDKDLKRIKETAADILQKEFTEKLAIKDGYEIVPETGADVLRLQSSLIDLHLTAPDLSIPESKKSLIRSAGDATIYVDIYDSVSGELLARAIDHKRMREYYKFYPANSATNRRDLRNMVSEWSGALREHLNKQRS